MEKTFEKLVSLATIMLGNSISFVLALVMVLFWWINIVFTTTDIHIIIGDIIFGTTFLSLFIIQKSFNKFSASLHLKVNELVSSHESASNSVINVDGKTEREITELSREYFNLVDQVKELGDEFDKKKQRSKL